MERNDIVQWLVIFGIYGWMITSDIIFVGQPIIVPGLSKAVSVVVMVVALAGTDMYCQWAASKYVAIKMIVGSNDKTAHLFVATGEKGAEMDKAVYGVANLYTSTLPLGFLTKIAGVPEKVSKVKIQHICKFFERAKPVQGKCNYKGTIVDHNKVAVITVRKVTMAYERGEIVPTFELERGNGDQEIERIHGPILPMMLLKGNPHPDLVKNFRLALKVIAHLNRIVGVYKDQASTWHTDSIGKDGQIKSMTQELNAVHKDNPNVETGSIRLVQALDRNEGDIQRLGKKGSWMARLPKWVGPVIMCAMVVGFLVYVTQQPDFWNWFGQGNTQIWLIVIIALLLIGGFYWLVYRRRGKS